jgi:hypothetical protein
MGPAELTIGAGSRKMPTLKPQVIDLIEETGYSR